MKQPTFGLGNTTEAFWHRASGRLSNRDNLLFDIINEPHDMKPEELARGMQKMLDSAVPLKRFGTPEEIASFAVFLASEKASFCTGSVVRVDGGQSPVL